MTVLAPHRIEVVAIFAFLIYILVVLLVDQVLRRVAHGLRITVRIITVLSLFVLALLIQPSQLTIKVLDRLILLLHKPHTASLILDYEHSLTSLDMAENNDNRAEPIVVGVQLEEAMSLLRNSQLH